MADADDLRLRVENEAPVRRKGAYVLHWMTEARRTRWNRALSRSVTLAKSLGRPLLVLEAFRSDTRYACARFHRFVLDGMADQAARFEAAGIAYYPYVEPVPGSGKGLLPFLAEDACAVVTDASPASFHPRMRAAAAKRVGVRLEAVDGSGLLPRAAIRDALDDPFVFLARFRRALPPLAFLGVEEDPLAAPPPRRLEKLPKEATERWHPVRLALLEGDPDLLARFQVDGTVAPSPVRGGEVAAHEAFAAALRAPVAAFAPDLAPWGALRPPLRRGGRTHAPLPRRPHPLRRPQEGRDRARRLVDAHGLRGPLPRPPRRAARTRTPPRGAAWP